MTRFIVRGCASDSSKQSNASMSTHRKIKDIMGCPCGNVGKHLDPAPPQNDLNSNSGGSQTAINSPGHIRGCAPLTFRFSEEACLRALL